VALIASTTKEEEDARQLLLGDHRVAPKTGVFEEFEVTWFGCGLPGLRSSG
jgi:hypothetical protein